MTLLASVTPPVGAEVDYARRNVYDYTYDRAGIWPFNTAYEAESWLTACVARLRSFTEGDELIRAGIPLIISVSFEKDHLDGAGNGTNGHLMVVAGFTDSGDVVVNDCLPPAQGRRAGAHDVPPRPDGERLGPSLRRPVYVIHPEWGRVPHARSEANWYSRSRW